MDTSLSATLAIYIWSGLFGAALAAISTHHVFRD